MPTRVLTAIATVGPEGAESADRGGDWFMAGNGGDGRVLLARRYTVSGRLLPGSKRLLRRNSIATNGDSILAWANGMTGDNGRKTAGSVLWPGIDSTQRMRINSRRQLADGRPWR